MWKAWDCLLARRLAWSFAVRKKCGLDLKIPVPVLAPVRKNVFCCSLEYILATYEIFRILRSEEKCRLCEVRYYRSTLDAELLVMRIFILSSAMAKRKQEGLVQLKSQVFWDPEFDRYTGNPYTREKLPLGSENTCLYTGSRLQESLLFLA